MEETEIKDILVINPGSTSTKIAVFSNLNKEVILENEISHDAQNLRRYSTLSDQEDFRKKVILDVLSEADYDVHQLSAVVGRGGMIRDFQGGGYRINEELIKRISSPYIPQHASNLGALLAHSIAEPLGIDSFIYDATMGFELMDIAKISGISEIERFGSIHLLNTRAQAIKYAKTHGKDYREINYLNCHMGGGITINAMKNGKVIDIASYDEGPMAPERSGGIPLLQFKELCFDGKHSEEEIDSLIAGNGGIYSYLGTKDCREVEKMIADGDTHAEVIYEAMAYQIAKSIAALSCAFQGDVDVIILTGGIAHSDNLVGRIRKYCEHIAPIEVMPGESEMSALADGALRMLAGEEDIKEL